MPPGTGTVLNVLAILLGASLGVLVGHRLPDRTRLVVTDGLGLVTLLLAGLNAASVLDPALGAAVGASAPLLVVLGAVLLGGIAGSLLRIEERLEDLGNALQGRLAGRAAAAPAAGAAERQRFLEGFVTASLVYCVGPLAILGPLSDGLGRGIEQLALKSALDGFASIAFAASLGSGVAASALAVAVVQGGFTLGGLLMGDLVPAAHVAALTATGGVLLAGVALRLLRVRPVPVGDLLPALLLAPLLTELVARLR
ncbi:MAG: DUF554 domain-containing protein [Actinomycetota bacterium]|nr:DUF554 domain-containing protein [Actinomycetota bacterium]